MAPTTRQISRSELLMAGGPILGPDGKPVARIDQWGPGVPPESHFQEQGPRRFDYEIHWNTTSGGPDNREPGRVTFKQLRAMAENCYQIRGAIETCKDQVAERKITFRVKPKPGESRADRKARERGSRRVAELEQFFQFPDDERDGSQWMRLLMEEMAVIDALSIYRLPNNEGTPYALEILNGDTIKVLIDEHGRRPRPTIEQILAGERVESYEQWVSGLKAYGFTYDELMYYPRNPRAHLFYGYGYVEQVITIINLALRRATSQIYAYTDGNIPEALIQVPDGWSPEQIEKYALTLHKLTSDPKNRHRILPIPHGANPSFPRADVLKDEFDEYVFRVVCWVFSISPNTLIKNLNRAGSEEQRTEADEQGMKPRVNYVERAITRCVYKWWGWTDIECVLPDEKSLDPKVQADIDEKYVTGKVLHPDEVRQRSLDLDPMDAKLREDMNPVPETGTDVPKSGREPETESEDD